MILSKNDRQNTPQLSSSIYFADFSLGTRIAFKDVYLRLNLSPLEVSYLLHKERENRSEGYDPFFFPPSLISSSVRDGVKNINRPVLQVNLQNHPVSVTNHNEKDLNKSGNNYAIVNGGHLNKIYIIAQDSIKIITWSTLHQGSPHSGISPMTYLTR